MPAARTAGFREKRSRPPARALQLIRAVCCLLLVFASACAKFRPAVEYSIRRMARDPSYRNAPTDALDGGDGQGGGPVRTGTGPDRAAPHTAPSVPRDQPPAAPPTPAHRRAAPGLLSCTTGGARTADRKAGAQDGGADRACAGESTPPPLPRTNRTSLVPPLVLIGHASSLPPCTKRKWRNPRTRGETWRCFRPSAI